MGTASPRIGAASPRIGAASPRIGAASPRMRADSRERRRRPSLESASSLETARESAPSTILTVFKPSCLVGVNIVIVGTSMPLALAFLCACSSRWRSMRLSRDEVVDARDAGDDDGEGDAGTARGGGSFRAGERMRERGDVPGNEGFTGDGSGRVRGVSRGSECVRERLGA